MLRRSRTPFSVTTTSRHARVSGVANKVSKHSREKARTMRNCLNFRGLTHGLIGLTPALRVDEVGGKYGVNEGRLSQTGLT